MDDGVVLEAVASCLVLAEKRGYPDIALYEHDLAVVVGQDQLIT